MSAKKNSSADWYRSEADLKNLEYLEERDERPARSRLHEVLLEHPLARLDIPRPLRLDVNDSVKQAVDLMRSKRHGSVLVLEEGRLAGIFTEKDLLVRTSGKSLDLATVRLRDVMTPDPQALAAGDPIACALHLMSVGEYRHVPIVDDGNPAGFVSIRGILRYLTRHALSGA